MSLHRIPVMLLAISSVAIASCSTAPRDHLSSWNDGAVSSPAPDVTRGGLLELTRGTTGVPAPPSERSGADTGTGVTMPEARVTHASGEFWPIASVYTVPVSGAGGFFVIATDVHTFKNGLVFAGVNGPAALPFGGGILCAMPPLKRGPIGFSGGTGANLCDCGFATEVNDGAIVPAGLDPGPGNTGWYQWWYRDPANGSGSFGTALSDAIRIEFQ